MGNENMAQFTDLVKPTFSLGTLCIRTSSVIDPTTTAVLPSRPPFFMFWANREMDIGGRLILLMKSLLRTTLLNLALVLLARNLYSCNK